MMYQSFAAIFIAQAFGIDMPLGQQVAMLLVLMLSSKGMASVPRGSVVVVAAIAPMFHLPVEGVALVLADRPGARHGPHDDQRDRQQHRHGGHRALGKRGDAGGRSAVAVAGRARRPRMSIQTPAMTETSDAPGPAVPRPFGVVGVLGGMGPLATIDFLGKLVAATPADTDQDHVPFVVSAIPQVPDRTQAFRGEGPSPLAAMISSAQRVKAAGAGLAVIACNTAHLWFDDIEDALGLPMIHLVDAALQDAIALAGPGGRIGLLGTDATLASGLYVNRAAATGLAPVHWLLPTAREMIDCVERGIDAVKSGDLATGLERLARAARRLNDRGADVVILGCTEIPVVLNDANSPVPVVDATAALARRAVAWSLGCRERVGGRVKM